MKKLFLLIFLFASVMVANAKSVVFTLSNGTLVYYLLGGETNPMMRFVDGKVVVNTDSYEFTDIKNFYISDTDDPTAISSVPEQKEAQFAGNVLVVKGDDAPVKVYSINGQVVEANIIVGGGNTSVDLTPLQKGTYIVKVGSSSFKVMKK